MSNVWETMTKEQLIDLLKNRMTVKDILYSHCSERLALEMAFKALKEQQGLREQINILKSINFNTDDFKEGDQ